MKFTFKPYIIIQSILVTLILLFCSYSSASTQKTSVLPKNYLNLYTENDVEINQKLATIFAKGKISIKFNKLSYSADNLLVYYTTLYTIADFTSLKRIESKGNVEIISQTSSGIHNITADHYVYSQSSQVHVLEAINNPVVYKDLQYILTTKDRIEYFADKNVAIIRGQPCISNSSSSKRNFSFTAETINIQLTTSKSIDFAEAVNKVHFHQDNYDITADYAIYYTSTGKIEFYNNIVFKTPTAVLKGCSAIYNMKTNKGYLIPCNKDSSIEGHYGKSKN